MSQLVEHRRALLLVVGRLGDHRHKHLNGLSIDHRLGVLTCLEATAGYGHDARFLVGEVDLVCGTRTGRGRCAWLTAGLVATGRGLGGAGEFGLVIGLHAGKVLDGARIDLDHGRGDGCQAILAGLEIIRNTHPVGDVDPVSLLGQRQQLLKLAF